MAPRASRSRTCLSGPIPIYGTGSSGTAGPPILASHASSMKSAPSIAFDYEPSRPIAALVLVLVVAAALAPWLSALPFAAKVVLSFAVLTSGLAANRRFMQTAFRRIAYRASGWSLVDDSGVE